MYKAEISAYNLSFVEETHNETIRSTLTTQRYCKVRGYN